MSLQAAGDDPAIAALFAQRGATGAMVLSSLRSGQVFVHNEARATHRFTPASTVKILNTLIAVEEALISGKDALFRWDGTKGSIPEWNRDQTLASTFKVSCIWCYQDLARKVGAARYRDYLASSAYVQLHEPFEETTFWLDGALEISALEQVAFLKRLYQRSLPFSDHSYETLREIMRVEQAPVFTLRAKSGLGGRSKPQVGWYVGYLETAADVWFFATNLEIHNQAELPLRQQLPLDALMAKGIIAKQDISSSSEKR